MIMFRIGSVCCTGVCLAGQRSPGITFPLHPVEQSAPRSGFMQTAFISAHGSVCCIGCTGNKRWVDVGTSYAMVMEKLSACQWISLFHFIAQVKINI